MEAVVARPKILFYGFEAGVISELTKSFKEADTFSATSVDEFTKFANASRAYPFTAVLCSPTLDLANSEELAQVARMNFLSIPIYCVCTTSETFDRNALIKNGFTEAFLLPIDKVELIKTLAKLLGKSDDVYSAVCLVDIAPGTKLDFQISLFLSANNKFLIYAAAGDQMSGDRFDRLKKFNVNSVYIPVNQLQDFYKFSARRLIELGKPGTMSETERKDKLRSSVRDLMTGILSESYSKGLSSGHSATNHARKIVDELIVLDFGADWYQRLVQVTGRKGDSYSHSSSVSTYAALFSMALDIGSAQDLAIAGMFHDLGITQLPPELQLLRPDQMTKEQYEEYLKHPEYAIETLKSRQLTVSDAVLNAIREHHRVWPTDKISREGQVLILADRFDYLTTAAGNMVPMEPEQALTQIARERIVDPMYINELQSLFAARKAA
jgi:HD-GYP domain-containing protein (c-di-GMP phosphodiesterase class II)